MGLVLALVLDEVLLAASEVEVKLSVPLLKQEEDDSSDDGQEVETGEDDSDDEPAVTDVVDQSHALLEVQGLGCLGVGGGPCGHVSPKLSQLQGVVENVEYVRDAPVFFLSWVREQVVLVRYKARVGHRLERDMRSR